MLWYSSPAASCARAGTLPLVVLLWRYRYVKSICFLTCTVTDSVCRACERCAASCESLVTDSRSPDPTRGFSSLALSVATRHLDHCFHRAFRKGRGYVAAVPSGWGEDRAQRPCLRLRRPAGLPVALVGGEQLTTSCSWEAAVPCGSACRTARRDGKSCKCSGSTSRRCRRSRASSDRCPWRRKQGI